MLVYKQIGISTLFMYVFRKILEGIAKLFNRVRMDGRIVLTFLYFSFFFQHQMCNSSVKNKTKKTLNSDKI